MLGNHWLLCLLLLSVYWGGTSLCKDIWDRLGTVIGAGIIISMWKLSGTAVAAVHSYLCVYSCRTSFKSLLTTSTPTHICTRAHTQFTFTYTNKATEYVRHCVKLPLLQKADISIMAGGSPSLLQCHVSTKHGAEDIPFHGCKEIFRLFVSGNCRLHCIMWT